MDNKEALYTICDLEESTIVLGLPEGGAIVQPNRRKLQESKRGKETRGTYEAKKMSQCACVKRGNY